MSKKKNNLNNETDETPMTAEEEETVTADTDGTEDIAGEAEEAGAAEEVSETEENAGEPETEAEDSEEKPEKKERKLKWAKAANEAVNKKAKDLEAKLSEANDRYVRLFAEFDNFRNRSEKEKAQRYDFGAKDMVEKILPVIDNFERGLAAVPEDKAEDSFVTGMQMTYKQLIKALEDAGVKQIEAVGKEFNPDYHNAVMHVEDPDVGENIIVEEFQKGYTYKDHVVRYSMVKVAN